MTRHYSQITRQLTSSNAATHEPTTLLAAAVGTVVGSPVGDDEVVDGVSVDETTVLSVVCVMTVGSSVDEETTSVSVVCVTADVSVAVTIVEVAPLSGNEVLVKVVVSVSAVVIVVPIRPPPRVGIAYGGSKSPNRPQALHFSKRLARHSKH